MSNRYGNTLFVDTNILLDIMNENRPQCHEARELAARCNGKGDMGLISSHSLKDIYYIVSKRKGETAGRRAIRFLMDLFVIAPVTSEECLISLDDNEPDFEDGLIRACAELNRADFIITRDAAAFQKCKIRAVTPAEYLEVVA